MKNSCDKKYKNNIDNINNDNNSFNNNGYKNKKNFNDAMIITIII